MFTRCVFEFYFGWVTQKIFSVGTISWKTMKMEDEVVSGLTDGEDGFSV